MDRALLKKEWEGEEKLAHIKGWDFSHIQGRYEEENDLPWDYEKIVRAQMKPEHRILDLDTGGGEFLLSLGHPPCNTSATEAYPPNVSLCKEKLTPLGIDFHNAQASGILPFADDSFDIVLNRHGEYNAAELLRVLKSGGIFITQQVGAENDRALVRLLLHDIDIPFSEQYAGMAAEKFAREGFSILRSEEAFRPIRFFDVGALVWFARIIEWEFPGFCVEKCLHELYAAQELLEKQGCIEGTIHRFLLIARK